MLYKIAQLKSNPQHTGVCSTVARPPRCLCYRPGVFFRHFRLIALPFPQGTARQGLKKCY